MYAWLKVFPFIITLGTQYILNGATYLLTDGISKTIYVSDVLKNIGGFNIRIGSGALKTGVIVMVVAVIVGSFILNKTYLGRNIYALGSNPDAVALSGVSVTKMRILIFVLAGIPHFGITAYLWGMLASELFLTALHLGALRRRIPFSWDPWNMILKPAALLVISVGLVRFLLGKSAFLPLLSPFFSAAFQIALLTLCYGGLLLLFHRSGRA